MKRLSLFIYHSMHLIEKHSRRCLLEDLHCAGNISSRLIGLIGRRSVPGGYGLYFPRCNSIHTCFMGVIIDIIYIDTRWKVIKTVREMKPWRFSCCRAASGVIETAAGWIERQGVVPGMELEPAGSGAERL